jgi:hypothetical protein
VRAKEWGAALVAAVAVVTTACGPDTEGAAAGHPPPRMTAVGAVTVPDVSAGNRAEPLPGLPDWSRAGYREGAGLPDASKYTTDEKCLITPEELAADYDVRADDDTDDSAGLQEAIDHVRTECTPDADFDTLSLLTLPAGTLTVTRQLWVDASYLTIRGASAEATTVVFRPDENTRYDTLTKDGSTWDQDEMRCGKAKGGWIWPGRGLFRVQSREVDEDYADACTEENRGDLVAGTVNVHWKAGVPLAEKKGTDGLAAEAGDTTVELAKKSENFAVGGLVNLRAANTMAMYSEQEALPTDHELQNLHMRQRMYRITKVDGSTITLDRPLDLDVPVSSTSDGSEPIDGKDAYESKAAPVVSPVVGVGFENFGFTQDLAGLPKLDGGSYDLDPNQVKHDYGNAAPEYAMHGIVFKWAADSWVRGLRITMTGSHPIVTEEAKNLEIVGNVLDGSWNKGKGGNGYFRGSRVWDSVYAGNVSRNLRHFTLQWSASGNVVIGNDFDSDLNLHGGWERQNLFENNVVRVPYEHAPGNCSSNCGGEGGETDDASTWYPIWWGAGKKAVKWSGSSGPQNVFFNNTLAKQTEPGGEYVPFGPYGTDKHTVFQFGWQNGAWQHLSLDGTPIADWAGHETADFTGTGVDTSLTHDGPSLFLRSLG